MDVGVGELLTSDHFHLDVGERVLEVGEEVVHARVLGLRGRFPREAPLGSHGRMVIVPCCAGLRRTQTDLTSRSQPGGFYGGWITSQLGCGAVQGN